MPQLGRIIQFCLVVIQGHFLFKKIFPVASQVVEWTLISGRNSCFKKTIVDFPGGPVIKNPPANSRDTGSIPGMGRSHMFSN